MKGMYTSAGNFSLRNSFPAIDSGVAKKLRENGVVILGKLGLSEYANFFGNQPSGFSNLTGQVLNARRRRPEPERLVLGLRRGGRRGAVGADDRHRDLAARSSRRRRRNGLVGLRPTVGLVPGYGIAPISASQDTAGPMDRTVANAAMTLQSIAGPDPHNADYYRGIWGPGIDDADIIPPVPATVPNYMSRAGPELRARQADRLERHADRRHAAQARPMTRSSPAGAILVERPMISPGRHPGGSVLNYEAHRDIDQLLPRTSARTRRSSRSPRRSPTTRPTRRRR